MGFMIARDEIAIEPIRMMIIHFFKVASLVGTHLAFPKQISSSIAAKQTRVNINFTPLGDARQIEFFSVGIQRDRKALRLDSSANTRQWVSVPK